MYRRATNLEYCIVGPREHISDVCSYLNGTYSNILIKIVMTAIQKNSNIVHPCPYAVSISYLTTFIV